MMIVSRIVSIIVILLFALYQSVYIIANKYTSVFLKVVAFVVICAVVFIGVQRTTYLPFLGRMAIHQGVLKSPTRKKEGDIEITVKIDAPDNTRVVYWASKPSTTPFKSPAEAYADSENVGVSVVKDKMATFFVTCPSSYKVQKLMRTLRPHVHYRFAMSNGLISEVKTVDVKCA
jgi:energy-coupling factor transporter transmembrane protein EcfT